MCMQVEFILMGGTFMSLPLDYRDFFIRGLHDALSGHMSSNVDEAVKYSEQSHTRCIGLTIETRPDYCLTPHLQQVCTYPSDCLSLWLPSLLTMHLSLNFDQDVQCMSACYLDSLTPTWQAQR